MTSRSLKAVLTGFRELSASDKQDLRWLFEHTHKGIRGHVTSILAPQDLGEIVISGTFVRLSDGARCGKWQRNICAIRGQLHVFHGRCSLHRSARGHGIGRAWVKTSIARYRSIGVHAVEVAAGSRDGGYVWAAFGFQLSTIGGTIPIQEYVEDFWPRRRGVLRTLRRQGHLSENEYQTICQRFEDVDFTGVQDILRLGRRRAWTDEQGRRQWVGKRLLAGSNWHGTLVLDS